MPGLNSCILMSVLVLLRRPLLYICVVAALACRPVTGTTSATSSYIRPDYRDHDKMARWLIAENDWGVVSTTSQHLSGVAFGNLVSYSDGPRGNSTGRLLFYLTKLDATAIDVEESAGATLTVGEIQLEGGCKVVDPEDPTCAKVSISGRMAEVPEGGIDEAKELLFSRHPQMEGWPKGHNFRIYELQTDAIRLLDFYGGAADVSSKDYLAAQLEPETPQHTLH